MEFPKVNIDRQKFDRRSSDLKYEIYSLLSKKEDEYMILEYVFTSILKELKEEQIRDRFNKGETK